MNTRKLLVVLQFLLVSSGFVDQNTKEAFVYYPGFTGVLLNG